MYHLRLLEIWLLISLKMQDLIQSTFYGYGNFGMKKTYFSIRLNTSIYNTI